MPSQKRMFRAARRRLADRDEAMLALIFGPNPISDAELASLIKRHPERYSAYAGYLGKRGEA